MKALPLLLLMLPSLRTLSQEKIDFRTNYLPGHVYQMAMTSKINVTINFDSASQEVLDALKDKGLTNPTVKDISVSMTSTATTGQMGDSSKIPVKMEVGQIEMTPAPPSPLPGKTTMFGTVRPGEMPTIDSVSGSDMNSSARATFIKTITSMFDHFKLPKAELSVGDSAVSDAPIEIPVPGIKMKLNMHIVYKLAGITGGMANFDITMKIGLRDESASLPFPFEASGDGAGTMIYDPKEQFPMKYDLSFKLNMRMVPSGMVIKAVVAEDVSSVTTITAL